MSPAASPSPDTSRFLEAATQACELGSFDQAFDIARRALERAHPGERADLLRLQGLILKECGQFERALVALTGAESDHLLMPNPMSAWLARLYYERGQTRQLLRDWPGAASDFRRALEAEPTAQSAYQLGTSLAEMRLWAEARDSFATCLQLDPYGRDEYMTRLV